MVRVNKEDILLLIELQQRLASLITDKEHNRLTNLIQKLQLSLELQKRKEASEAKKA